MMLEIQNAVDLPRLKNSEYVVFSTLHDADSLLK